MYAIEKSIPVPTEKQTKWKFIKEMKPGDSFFVPSSDYKVITNVQSTVYTIMKRHGMKPRLQRLEDGLRVWRVE